MSIILLVYLLVCDIRAFIALFINEKVYAETQLCFWHVEFIFNPLQYNLWIANKTIKYLKKKNISR